MQEGPFNVLRHKEWDRAPKDPVSMIAIGNAAFATVGASTSSLALLYATGLAVQIGISAVTSWALSALAPKPDVSGVGRGLKTNIRDPASPHDFVYGKIRKGGTITYLEGEPSDTNKFLSMIIVLAGHKVNSIGDIYINDELATINGSGYVTNDRWSVSSDSLPHKIQIFKYDGTQSTPSGPLQTNSEQVDTDANFIGNDISYLYVRLNYASEVFTGGIPTFTAVVEGKEVYDPRTATTAYSANAALCIRDYLVAQYGLDEDTINIDDTSFTVAANVCDEDVDLVDYWSSGTTPTEKRYEINGVLSAANTPNVNLQKMMTACAGTLFWGGGKWKLKVGDYIAPTLSLGLDDVRGPINVSTKTSRRDNFNTVRGTFVNYDPLYEVDGSPAPINWLVQDYPEIESATFITEDNDIKIPLDLELPLTTSSSMAQRLAKMTLLRAREQITLSVDFSVAAFEAQVGEVIEFTAERYGWTNKEFEVVGWRFFISEDGDLRVNLSLRETSEAAFAWDADERQIIANNTNLPDYRVGVTVANLTAVNNGGRVSADGTWWPRVRLSWDSSASGFVDSYDIRYKVNGEADTLYRYTSATQNSVTINDLSDGQTYYFEVRARTGAGYVGAWASTTLAIAEDTTAPAIPSGLTATGQISAIELNWNPVSDADLSHYLVYRNSTNNSGTASLIGQTASTRFTDYVGPDLAARYYWLKAVDFSGNTSGFSSVASGTSNYITQLDVDIDDVLEGAVDVASFAAGIEPVTIATGTLPTTKSTEALFFDGDLYRWNGTTYVKTIDAPDITGKIATVQIDNDAITNALIANNAVQAENIANLAVTSEKVNNSAITTAKIAANAVTSGELASNSVTAIKVATNAITETKISSNAITAPKIAAGAVVADKISAGAVTAGKIAAGAVTATEIASGSVTTAKLAAGSVIASKIAANTITASQIAANAITTSELAANAVIAENILAGAVNADKIAANTITANKIAANTITASQIASNTITAAQIAANAITASELSANSVVAGKIAAGAVSADEIAANAITAEKLAIGDFTNYASGSDFTPDSDIPWDFTGQPGFVVQTTSPGRPDGTLGRLLVNANSSTATAPLKRNVAVEPGDVIYMSLWAYRNTDYNGTSSYSKLRVTDATSSAFLTALGYGITDFPVNAWTKLETSYTVPNGVSKLSFQLTRDNTAGGALLDEVVIRKKLTGNLIVDGTITANLIQANAITTDKIAAGAVSSIKIADDIQSDNFSTGSQGWSISRNTGNAEFNDITVRGDVINLNEKFEIGISGNWYSFLDVGTNLSIDRILNLLGGAGTYAFILVGGGGSGAINYLTGSPTASGGGAGGLANFLYTWDGSTALTVDIGAGGAARSKTGASRANGNAGVASRFKIAGTNRVTANGGGGGIAASTSTVAGGAGGTVSYSLASTYFPLLARSAAGERGGNITSSPNATTGGGGIDTFGFAGQAPTGGDATSLNTVASSGGGVWGVGGVRDSGVLGRIYGATIYRSARVTDHTMDTLGGGLLSRFGVEDFIGGFGVYHNSSVEPFAGNGGVFSGGGGHTNLSTSNNDAKGGDGGIGGGGGGAIAEGSTFSGAGGQGALFISRVS